MNTKRFLIVTTIICTFFLTNAFSFAPSTQVNPIYKAIQTGNVLNLSNYFCSSIQLSLPTGNGSFSKYHAKKLLESFFDKYKPLSFQNTHLYEQNNTFTATGILSTQKGKMKVYLVGRYYKNKKEINLIYISKENNSLYENYE